MPVTSPLTVADLLDRDALRDALRRADPVGVVLRSLAEPVRDLVNSRVVETLQEQLGDVDIGETVFEAWARVSELQAAAERTRSEPAAREDVTLVDHEVTSEHHPVVTVWLDGQVVASVELDLVLTATVAAVVAVIREGRLAALRGGEVTASARLAWKERDLLKSRKVTVLAGAVIPLGAGVPLVRDTTPLRGSTGSTDGAAGRRSGSWWERTARR